MDLWLFAILIFVMLTCIECAVIQRICDREKNKQTEVKETAEVNEVY